MGITYKRVSNNFMKTAIKILFFITFCNLLQTKLVAQVCAKKLPIPDKTFLNSIKNSDKAEIEYFQKYFDGRSKSKGLKNSTGNNNECKKTYNFKNGIVYKREECSQSEIEVIIFFPGYCKSELVKYVEWFFKTEWNSWNNDKTSYQPTENGDAGCYIEIKQYKKGFYIKYICSE